MSASEHFISDSDKKVYHFFADLTDPALYRQGGVDGTALPLGDDGDPESLRAVRPPL